MFRYHRKCAHSGIQYLPPEEFEDIVMDELRKQSLRQITLKLPSEFYSPWGAVQKIEGYRTYLKTEHKQQK